jgi:hypothetical protein
LEEIIGNMKAQLIEIAEVREDNLFEIARCRAVEIDNFFDKDYPAKIR